MTTLDSIEITHDHEREIALSRQSEIIPPQIGDLTVLIVGVGGIGSNAAYALASMGVRRMALVDGQNVALENIYPGYFRREDIGKNKAKATAERIEEELGVDGIVPISGLFGEYLLREYDIIIVGTDSLSSRREVWETFGGEGFQLWIDGRMGGTNAEVYAILGSDEELKTRYNMRLQGEDVELPCGLKATAPLTKGVIPSLISQAVFSYIAGDKPNYCSMYNLQAGRTIIAKR